MYKPLPQIAEPLEDLQAQLRRTRDPQRRRRLHLLVLLGAGEVHSRQEAAAHLAVHRNTIGRWLSAYESGGLEELLTLDTAGARPEQRTLSPAVLEALRERLAREGFASYREEGFASYGEIVSWLAKEHGVVVPYPTLHKLVRYPTLHKLVRYGLGAKLKRARPVHVKKTSPTWLPSPRGSDGSSMQP